MLSFLLALSLASAPSILNAMLLALLLTVTAAGESKLQAGNSFTWGGCYARFQDGHLSIGNAHIARQWRVVNGELFPERLHDLDSNREWIDTKVPQAAPSLAGPAMHGEAQMSGADGVFGPTEEHALRAELKTTGARGEVRYEFQVYPQASGVRMWVERSLPSSVSTSASVSANTSSHMPSDDVLERLKLTSPHIRLVQVSLRDRTDDHNELAFETEWLLQPNESNLSLRGNLFALEDVLTGDGVVLLKEAPQPEMRPIQSVQDAWIDGSGMTHTSRGGTLAYDVAFTGHGMGDTGRGYPYALLTYQGGQAGRIAALHRYQRQIRAYLPGRDGLLITNTWGDRSGTLRINEAFIEREVASAKRLGADLMQVDDGWETGKTIGAPDKDGIWEGYWSKPNFWTPNPERFPRGLAPMVDDAHRQNVKIGLWFGPDSTNDFGNWRRDADYLLSLHQNAHVDSFKLDSVKIRSKLSETNYRHLIDRLQQQTDGKLLLDVDVTAETRQGYFGNIAAGPLFVENRYTDLHRYWPHQTLRNFWKLSHYIDPLRLRMEFLNNTRNTALYQDDPLAPAAYDPACLFAITMFGSPLGWFEAQDLPPAFVASASPLINAWKLRRDAIHKGTILPIGEEPDGVHWTGFTSLDVTGRGYLLVFRELNESADWTVPAVLGTKATVLGGKGSMHRDANGKWVVHVDAPLGFVWAEVTGGTEVRRAPS